MYTKHEEGEAGEAYKSIMAAHKGSWKRMCFRAPRGRNSSSSFKLLYTSDMQ